MAIHIPLPRKAMIRSKSGNTTAIMTGSPTVPMRMSARYKPRRRGGEGEVMGVREVGDRPRRMSRVVEMGRVLRGILVMGMMAMTETTM